MLGWVWVVVCMFLFSGNNLGFEQGVVCALIMSQGC